MATLIIFLVLSSASAFQSLAEIARPRVAPSIAIARPHVPIIRSPPPAAIATLDLPLGLASWAFIVAYQIASSRFNTAWAGQNAESRAVWTRYILEKGDYILGVQTLRCVTADQTRNPRICHLSRSIIAHAATR